MIDKSFLKFAKIAKNNDGYNFQSWVISQVANSLQPDFRVNAPSKFTFDQADNAVEVIINHISDLISCELVTDSAILSELEVVLYDLTQAWESLNEDAAIDLVNRQVDINYSIYQDNYGA